MLSLTSNSTFLYSFSTSLSIFSTFDYLFFSVITRLLIWSTLSPTSQPFNFISYFQSFLFSLLLSFLLSCGFIIAIVSLNFMLLSSIYGHPFLNCEAFLNLCFVLIWNLCLLLLVGLAAGSILMIFCCLTVLINLMFFAYYLKI